jgi:hypothetical protein
MWDGDTGEFVPLFTQADLEACDAAEIPVVRRNPFVEEYEQRDISGEWVLVGKENNVAARSAEASDSKPTRKSLDDIITVENCEDILQLLSYIMLKDGLVDELELARKEGRDPSKAVFVDVVQAALLSIHAIACRRLGHRSRQMRREAR